MSNHRTKPKLRSVDQIPALELGRHFAGNGLYFAKSAPGKGSWLLRYERGGRERWHGLGPLQDFTLTEARKRAKLVRQQLRDGHDPIDARKAERAKAKLEAAARVSFEKAAMRYFDAHKVKWGAKHAQQFWNTLREHVFPLIGSMAVGEIDKADVRRVLERDEFWWKHVTASRVRGRIELILDWAAEHDYRSGPNPAWRGNFSTALPTGVVKPVHHAAMDYADAPDLVSLLAKMPTVAARALEMIILSASRSGEVLGMKWHEIDLDKKLWVVPAERMKARKEHRVPLTNRMIKLLGSLPHDRDDSLVFGATPDRQLAKMAMPKLLAKLKIAGTAHGMRSCFRDFAAEQTSFPHDVIEAALAHSTGSASERAYKRTDLLEKRRELMEAWSAFVEAPLRKAGGNVVAFPRVARDLAAA